jgi:uncharacterized protein (DUF433 family)
MKYTCINIQGNLISEEILNSTEKGTNEGQTAKDFGFDLRANLRSEIEYAWSRIKLDWKHFTDKSSALPTNDQYGTTLARKWMEGFLSSIGFDLDRPGSSLVGDNGQFYTISHTAENLDNLPIHIVGFVSPNDNNKNTLDIKSSGGTSRLSPHATVQEYLNVTEHLYGIATNGLSLRLIRDSGRLVKLTYLEFDLKRMLDADKYSEFTLLYRLIHASRFSIAKGEADQCLIEKYYQDSIETGNRIRDGLSNAVKESLTALGIGFLQHESNEHLRRKIRNGELSAKDFYRQLLRLVYRLLFLMVTEERDLIYNPDDKDENVLRKRKIYLKYYSIARLRKLSESKYLYEKQFNDLWQGLINTFELFDASGKGKRLDIQPLDGDLFSETAIQDIESSLISNNLLLECIRNLNEFTDTNNNLVPINYRALDVEEFGSVYEGLLELHPIIENIESLTSTQINFLFHEGTERKTTGSYYTRPDLVNELIKSAVIPVIEARLKEFSGQNEKQSQALLQLKVCDAAAGSGHMLLAAARTIAWYLARVKSNEENPSPSVYRSCLREVIQHCIYGVDMNPDAVELCKLSLWLESHNCGKPLSFLDHKIRCGNSLVGVTDLKVLTEPLPDKAFEAITGDDPQICRELKRQNSSYRKKKQANLFSASGQKIEEDKEILNSGYHEIDSIQQDSVEAIKEVKKKFLNVRNSVFHEEKACHIWTASFFKIYSDVDDPTNPSSEKLAQYFFAPTQFGRLVAEATVLAEKYKFFHWPLEFPDVFQQGGFDIILGNPPWERIKLQEQEYFSSRDASIAEAPSKAAREKLIKYLPQTNPTLYEEYLTDKHAAEAQSKFIRESGRFPDTATGDINTYSVFSEMDATLISKKGRVGIIVPTGIATDDNNKYFFASLTNENRIVSLFDFENREGLFPGVHRSYKFCLLTVSGGGLPENYKSNYGFFLTNIEHLKDELRIFHLNKNDFATLNPNTKTCPGFRTSIDASLTLKLYNNSTILANDETEENEFGVYYMRLVHYGDHANRISLMPDNAEVGRIELILEPKMFWQYDHRFSSFENCNRDQIINGQPIALTEYQKADSNFRVICRYYTDWLFKTELFEKYPDYTKKWLILWRDVSNATNERTSIAAIVPFALASVASPALGFDCSKDGYLLCANFNCIIYDYLARQKVNGIHFNWGLVKQVPIIPLYKYDDESKSLITSKLIELTYTSWDIKSFADEIWSNVSEESRNIIQKQWKENADATGGHTWTPPSWINEPTESSETIGCPLPPFKYDEGRRSKLKAEIDAIYAKLYGVSSDELRYILDPADVYGVQFPGETFRVMREKEIRQYGEYRTKRLVLDAWSSLLEKAKVNKSSEFSPEQATLTDINHLTQNMKEWSLHDGIYSIQDCARITRLSADKIRRWFGELYKEKYEGFGDQRRIEVTKLRISFHGLIELVVIGTLRENKFSLKKILAARKDLKSKTKKEYPFATNNVRDHLKVSGSDILFEFPEGLVTLNGTGQINLDFIKTFFKDIHFNMDGIAESLMPEKGKGKITINPKEANGKPAIIKKEVPVDTILQFYTDRSSIQKIQVQFNLEEDEVLAAIAYNN